jgi:hypothetical protein
MDVLVKQTPGSVTCDFEAAKEYLNGRLAEYKGMIFTEDSKKEAKNTVASLRKEKKAFSDRVKEVKDEYMKPFNDFKAKADELIGLYDEPIDFINEQVEDFEKNRIVEKKKAIVAAYTETVAAEYQEIIPLERIYNAKWENATYKLSVIKLDLTDINDRAIRDVETIRNTQSDYVDEAIQMYKNTLDVSACLNHIMSLEKRKQEALKAEQERVKREEEERIRREERAKIEAERRAEEEKAAAVEAAKEEFIESLAASVDAESATELYEYRMALSAEQKDKLEMYLNSVGIEWEMV